VCSVSGIICHVGGISSRRSSDGGVGIGAADVGVRDVEGKCLGVEASTNETGEASEYVESGLDGAANMLTGERRTGLPRLHCHATVRLYTAVFWFALLATRKWPMERVQQVARMMVAL
jgi:hypothetical protein